MDRKEWSSARNLFPRFNKKKKNYTDYIWVWCSSFFPHPCPSSSCIDISSHFVSPLKRKRVQQQQQHSMRDLAVGFPFFSVVFTAVIPHTYCQSLLATTEKKRRQEIELVVFCGHLSHSTCIISFARWRGANQIRPSLVFVCLFVCLFAAQN